MLQPRSILPTSASSATLASSTSSQSLNPSAGSFPNSTGMGATTPSPLDFPFIYLHIEMVRHFREKDTELAKERELWLEKLKQCDEQAAPGQLEQDEEKRNEVAGAFSRRIFAHTNCESRLEAIGYRVGQVMVERVARPLPRLNTELEIMKFICKDFWNAAFGKGVDNLKTNHQGIYTMQDNRFCTLTSFAENGQQYLKESVVFLALPAGVLRGALASMGLDGVVTATVEHLPTVVFKVELQRSPGNA